MDYFDRFVSNTTASTGNQFFFCPSDRNSQQTCRLFYKVFAGGRYNYSFLFSNILDSTFGKGLSHKNTILNDWQITSVRAGSCDDCDPTAFINFQSLRFDEKQPKTVFPEGFFCTDPIPVYAEKDSYICLEISYSGSMIPCHTENLIPSFVLSDGEWVPSKNVPVASMIGCDRKVTAKIGYLGDSITQGIGVSENSYLNWSALLSEKLGQDYSYWNLGLGFGRADDAASDGAWLYKAKKTDITVVCYGVNDICNGFSSDEINNNLFKIADKLKESGNKVIFQTVPPFNYDNEQTKIWFEVNRYIKQELSSYVDRVFDVAPYLQLDEKNPEKSKYGPHPNAEGSAVWANAIYAFIKENTAI